MDEVVKARKVDGKGRQVWRQVEELRWIGRVVRESVEKGDGVDKERRAGGSKWVRQ